jgi:hypothetical protein
MTYPKINIFHSAVLLPKNHGFFLKNICHNEFFSHFEFSRKSKFFESREYGRHFECLCLATLILFSTRWKSIKNLGFRTIIMFEKPF